MELTNTIEDKLKLMYSIYNNKFMAEGDLSMSSHKDYEKFRKKWLIQFKKIKKADKS